jgi:hypothetical protein
MMFIVVRSFLNPMFLTMLFAHSGVQYQQDNLATSQHTGWAQRCCAHQPGGKTTRDIRSKEIDTHLGSMQTLFLLQWHAAMH